MVFDKIHFYSLYRNENRVTYSGTNAAGPLSHHSHTENCTIYRAPICVVYDQRFIVLLIIAIGLKVMRRRSSAAATMSQIIVQHRELLVERSRNDHKHTSTIQCSDKQFASKRLIIDDRATCVDGYSRIFNDRYVTLSLILLGAVDGTRHQGAPRMSWIHNVLKWSGKTYGELKGLAQDRRKWRRLTWEFSSAAELL